jgi:hypothetical protein
MRAPLKLGIYGGVLVAVFATAAITANAVVPDATVQNWTRQSDGHEGGHGMDPEASSPPHEAETSAGLALAQDGYRLTGVAGPAAVGDDGVLSLTVTGPDGQPVTGFDEEHDKELHLIVVRADGRHFRHVHPERDSDGTWTIPWRWDAAGSYRVFTDFVPSESGEGLTLSTSLQAAGEYAPEPATGSVRTTTSDGFEVSVDGDLVAGESSALTLTVSRDGEGVTALEPYLGAFGHLVALRDGDLAYLHVHPHGDEPAAGETSGPEIVFEATAPTPGRYLLYLDFQVDGEVHSAPLVLDTADAGEDGTGGLDGGTGESEEGDGHDHD